MSVSLAGNLPAAEMNGLAPAAGRLAANRHDGVTYLVVGVIQVTGGKEKKTEDFEYEPIVSFRHIELANVEHADTLQRILAELHARRTGKVQLDVDGEERPMVPQPLELVAEGGYRFMVREHEDGSYSIELVSKSTDEVIGGRYNLQGEEFDALEFAVGAFDDESKLPGVLLPYAQTLLAEWGRDADVDDEGVVDAEVVDDEDGE